WLPQDPPCISSIILLASTSLIHSNIGEEKPLLYCLSPTMVYHAANFFTFSASPLSWGSSSFWFLGAGEFRE
ncbi:hypothetical protein A2U01_0104842, partial [Trifolium medium]|nr:hypothetical protein [Trifolium medium]